MENGERIARLERLFPFGPAQRSLPPAGEIAKRVVIRQTTPPSRLDLTAHGDSLRGETPVTPADCFQNRQQEDRQQSGQAGSLV